jgi:hypothetical protein
MSATPADASAGHCARSPGFEAQVIVDGGCVLEAAVADPPAF